MSTYRVDIGCRITADTAEEAAAIAAALLSFGSEFMPIKPAFVGVRAPEPEPDKLADQVPSPAADTFRRIMESPSA